jgi:hypothetical protein
VSGQHDRIGERGGAGSHHHPGERQTALRIGVHDATALVERERCRLAGGAKHVEAIAAIGQEEARQRDRARAIGLAPFVDSGRDGGNHAMKVPLRLLKLARHVPDPAAAVPRGLSRLTK